MGFQHIRLEKKNGLAALTLCREPLNVLNIAMMKEINAALDSLAGETLKVLLFRADGKAFCAGVDVGEHLGDQVHEMIEVFSRHVPASGFSGSNQRGQPAGRGPGRGMRAGPLLRLWWWPAKRPSWASPRYK